MMGGSWPNSSPDPGVRYIKEAYKLTGTACTCIQQGFQIFQPAG